MPSIYILQGPDKGATFYTTRKPTVLGRRSADVPLSDHSISRQHAELRHEGGFWIIEDSQSSNGTYINGTRIHGPTRLKFGDRVRLGSSVMMFKDDDSSNPLGRPPCTRDLIKLEPEDTNIDSSILASASASDESVILASPDTYDAVHAWNVMYQLVETIGTFASVHEFIDRMVEIIFRHLQVDRLFVLMREPDTTELVPFVVRHRNHHLVGLQDKIVTSRRIINHVVDTREGVLCANAQADSRFGADQRDASVHRMGLRSVICVPILSHDSVVGVIHLDCGVANHTYTQQQLLLTTAIGKMAGMAIENARLIESRVRNERLAAVGETVAHLSHNIRNILQGMRSGADVIDMALARNSLDNVRDGWRIVQGNVDRTYRMATDMLTFSKDRQPLIEMARLNELVAEAVGLLEWQTRESGVVIQTELTDLPPMPLDLDGMHQVLSNILINAIDACPKDGGRVCVRTEYEQNADHVVLSISDNGDGIPEELRHRIFDPFHSTKGHGGTGLGLAAAKKIVDELNGTIEVGSSISGTTFTVRLNTSHPDLAESDETHGPVE